MFLPGPVIALSGIVAWAGWNSFKDLKDYLTRGGGKGEEEKRGEEMRSGSCLGAAASRVPGCRACFGEVFLLDRKSQPAFRVNIPLARVLAI